MFWSNLPAPLDTGQPFRIATKPVCAQQGAGPKLPFLFVTAASRYEKYVQKHGALPSIAVLAPFQRVIVLCPCKINLKFVASAYHIVMRRITTFR